MAEVKPSTVKIEVLKPIKINISKNFPSDNANTKKKTLKKPSRKFDEASAYKYSLPVIKPLPSASFKKYYIVAPYSRFLKKHEKDRTQKMRSISLQEKYHIAYYDLRKRLHIDDPPDDCLALTDIDPEFFTCVDASVLPCLIAPFKSLMTLVNRRLRTKQEIGYRNDCILNIDFNQRHEQKMYKQTVKKYTEQVKLLDQFISYDYQKSMDSLNDWEQLKIAVNGKINEYNCLASREFTLASNIIGLDYRYSLQQKYGRFLYYLSPPSWRSKNRDFAHSVEIAAKGFDLGSSSEEEKFTVTFEKLKTECNTGLVNPVLYFKEPNDLIDLFTSFEKQNLHHFTHVFKNTSRTVFLKKGIKLFHDIITVESANTLKDLHELEGEIKFYETHCNQLESKFNQILHGLFYESVGTTQVLKLGTHLEFCYERVFNEAPINMDLLGVAKALEENYMFYSNRLENVTSHKVKSSMLLCEKAEQQKFINAKKAARELRTFERLEKKLLHAYKPVSSQIAPLPPITTRPKATKKPLQKKAKNKSHDRRHSLSESQYEYLRLFTDWTENEDPTAYLNS